MMDDKVAEDTALALAKLTSDILHKKLKVVCLSVTNPIQTPNGIADGVLKITYSPEPEKYKPTPPCFLCDEDFKKTPTYRCAFCCFFVCRVHCVFIDNGPICQNCVQALLPKEYTKIHSCRGCGTEIKPDLNHILKPYCCNCLKKLAKRSRRKRA